MELVPMTLRLEAADGAFEEYRIESGAIEGRKLSHPDSRERNTPWRRLNPAELATHVRDNTILAQWLKRRLGWRRLLRACTDPETLQEFGIAENTLDRYAA